MFPGQLDTAVAQWFGRFTAGTESRQDTYLLGPHLPRLSVKIRGGGGALEVKMLGGSPGILEVAGRARGRMESWQKWSFSRRQPSPGSKGLAGWRQVHKRRRIGWFSLANEPLARVPAPGEQPGCTVELTEVLADGETWWSLGFEASGPAGLLRNVLEASAVLVFAEALPGGVEVGMRDSRSYAEWLWQRPGPAVRVLPSRLT